VYSKYQREKPSQLYDQCKSVGKVIQQLRYPSRKRLYVWIAQRNSNKNKKAPRKKYNNTPEHPRNPPLELKLEVIIGNRYPEGNTGCPKRRPRRRYYISQESGEGSDYRRPEK